MRFGKKGLENIGDCLIICWNMSAVIVLNFKEFEALGSVQSKYS